MIKEKLELSNNETIMLMSVIYDLQVGQVVDSEKTPKMQVDKKALSSYDLKY